MSCAPPDAMPALDWRALVIKYIKHVRSEEGVDFIEYHDRPESFTKEEWESLEVARIESRDKQWLQVR